MLLQIYQAIMEEPKIHLLDIHQNPSDQCIVGRHTWPVLTGMFYGYRESICPNAFGKKLADRIAAVRAEISR